MSGFCGWIGGSNDKHASHGILSNMGSRLPSYGVDQTHSCSNDCAGLALQSTTHMGSWADEHGVWATIEGTPRWTDADLAAIARRDGHAVALASAYTDKGHNLLDCLFGDFAFAVIDAKRQKGLLAIDRVGIKTLCVSESIPGILVFGTTTDSVRGFPGIGSNIRPQSVYDFLYFIDRIPAPQTVFDDQTKLLPGQFLSFDKGVIKREIYWQMPAAVDHDRSLDDFSSELNDRLRAAVSRQVNGHANAKLGAFLSGGLDSSTVVGLMAEVTQAAPQTFTIGFDIDAFDESEFADIAVKQFGAVHHQYDVTPADVLEAIPKIAAIYDEPFGNASAVPVYFCAKLAKEHGVDTMLAGDGGDEVFGGNSRYVDERVFDHYDRVPKQLRRYFLEPMVNIVPDWLNSSLFRKARNYIRFANMSVPERIARLNIYGSLPAKDMFDDSAFESIDQNLPLTRLEDLYNSTGTDSVLRRTLNLDMRLTLADSDLRKVNRMCEVAGTSVHYPFLDDDLVKFSASIPDDVLIKDNQLRFFYKHALRDFLPKEILAKKKHGFGLPFVEFTQRHQKLQSYVYDNVLALKKRNYFKDSFIDTAISHHRDGIDGPIAGIVWDLMTLEAWFQHHVDGQA